MKKLQNNYTTPEQSDRLLELGVPVDSADCYYQNALPEPKIITSDRKFQEYIDSRTGTNREIWYFKPCWSVGRLIEIICNCHIITNQLVENWICCDKNTNLIELLIGDIEMYTNVQHIDFSKLEE